MTTRTMQLQSIVLTAVSVLLLVAAPRSHAGVEAVLAKGFKPNIAYQVNELDAVNTFNGNLMVQVPLGPTYKTNGTLSYSFGLRHQGEIWNYISYHGITTPSPEPTHIAVVQGGGWEAYNVTVIGWDGGPSGGGSDFVGAEAVPIGLAGAGWTLATDSFMQIIKNGSERDEAYIDPTGATHTFGANMHAKTFCGGTPCNNTVAYTHDGSYIRMRFVDGNPLLREVDLPDGTIRRFRCTAECDNRKAIWVHDWTADPFGNVLLIDRVDVGGNPSAGRPAPGQWVWNYTEATLPDAETRSDPYFRGTPAERAALQVTRRHRLTFTVEDPNGRFEDQPWMLGVRLVRAELSGPQGDRSMVFELDYEQRPLLRPVIRPFILDPPRLVFPYNADKSINVWTLSAVRHPADAGKWQFAYYDGYESEVDEELTYTFCGDYTAPSGQCPAAQKYPTSRLSGRLKQVRAPAGGGYAYEYGTRRYPRRPCPREPHQGAAYSGGSLVGVKKRTQLNADGVPVAGAVWSYAGNGYVPAITGDDTCSAPTEFLASTLDPNGLLTLNYYVLKFADPWFGAPFSPEEYRANTLTRRDGTQVGRFLSSEIYQVEDPLFTSDLANAVRRMFEAYRRNDPPTSATLLRSTYASYELSSTDCDPEMLDCELYNLRMTSQHTRFWDDNGTTPVGSVTEGAYVETVYSDFDGVGHFRQKNTYGNLRAVGRSNATAPSDWDQRMEYTLFNPGVSWSPGQPTPSGLPLHWILGTYTHTSAMEPGWLVSSLHHFDPARGYLRASRSIKANGTSTAIPLANESARNLVAETGPDDFFTVYSRIDGTDDDGIPIVVSRAEYYGGDGGNLGEWQLSGDSVAIPPSATREYTIDTTFRYGGVAKIEYKTCDNNETYLQTESSLIERGMGLPLSITDSAGLTTSYAYDILGRVLNVTPPGTLAPETYTYKSKTGTAGMNSIAISRADTSVSYVYDGLGRLISESRSMPSGVATTAYTYTTTGKIFQQFLPMGNRHSEFRYDIFDREKKIIGADNKVTDVVYNGVRSAVRMIDDVAVSGVSDTAQLTSDFDSFGRLWLATDNATRAIYKYDAASNLILATLNPTGDGDKRQHRRFHYDGRGVLTTVTHPELRDAGTNVQVVLNSTYDAMGNVTGTDLAAQGASPQMLPQWRLRFDYDPAARLLEVWQPGSNGRKTFKSFDYYPATDPIGRRSRLKTSVRRNYFPDPSRTGGIPTIDVTTTRAYKACTGTVVDCTGLLESVTTVVSAPSASGAAAQSFFGGSVGYAYDSRGEISRIDYPTFGDAPPRGISYGYAKGYLTSVREGGARRAEISYHLNGLVNLVRLAAPGVSYTISADPSGLTRPFKIDWNWVGGSSSTGTYSYDGAGNISAMGVDSFQYDLAMRVTEANVAGQRQRYEYDGFGNLTSMDEQTVPAHWPTNRLGAPFVYDAAGNIVQMPDRRKFDLQVGNYKLTFLYDALNTMTYIDGTNLGRAFVYDASDERVGVIDYKAAGGRRELWSFRDQQQKVLRDFERTFTAAGASTWRWTKDYVYRGTILSNTIAPGSAGVRDVHVDHLGSTRFVTDSAGHLVAGATSSGIRYWPFGTLVFKRPLDERLAFTGHERDDDGTTSSEADFDYMHARYYGAGVGRFLSMDPTLKSAERRRPQSWNRYVYVENNPVNAVDPDGRIVETLWDLANVVIGAKSLYDNVSSGHYAAAAIDAVGVIVDGAAVVAPGVPGGVGTAIRVARASDKVDDVADIAKTVNGGRRLLPFKDSDRITEVNNTLDRIQDGARKYKQDGSVFRNAEGKLPDRPAGYYREYTVDTPGATNRGARRIVQGQSGETYYTDDHYNSFVTIDPRIHN